MTEDLQQKTDEWFAARCSKFTGSRFADLLSRKRDGKPTKAREDLIWTVATERIQGYQPQGPTSYSLQWGNDNEPLARDAYELHTGEFVTQHGFIQHPNFEFAGVSPDGLVGDEGMIEIKCPKSPEIHLQRFLYGVPDEYKPQIQGSLWVTGREWVDFVSFDPDTAQEFRLLIIRVERDEDFIANLEKEVIQAEHEVQALIEQLKQKVTK